MRKSIIHIPVVLLLLTLSISASAQERWTPVGTIRLEACKKLADGRVCVATNAGYLLWSTDDGVTFTHQEIDTGSGLNSVSFPQNSQELHGIGYIGADSNRIYKTSDGGSTWSELKLPITSGINYITAASVDTLFVCSGNGTFVRSIDGGKTWDIIPISTTGDLLKLFFLNSKHGYALTSYDSVLETTNSGDTWTPIFSPFANNQPITSFDVSPNGALFAGSTYGMVAVSQNDGMSWTTNRIDKNLALAFNFGKYVSEDTIIAFQNQQLFLYFSSNAGSTWDSINLSGSENYNDSWKSDSGILTLIGGLGLVWPVHLSAGIEKGGLGEKMHFYIPADDGLTATPNEPLHLSAVNFGTLGLGDLVGILFMCSTDGGYIWSTKSVKTTATGSCIGIRFTSDSDGILIRNSSSRSFSTPLVTSDAGISWSPITSSHYPPGLRNHYLEGTDGTMFMYDDTAVCYSTNNGFDWSLWGSCRVEPDSQAYTRYSILPRGIWGDTAYMGVYDPFGSLQTYLSVVTTDRGSSWAVSNQVFDARQTVFLNSKIGIAIDGDREGAVWTTQNGVLNWSGPTILGLPNRTFWDLEFNRPGTIGIICGDSGELFETFDTGKTWVPDSVPYFFNLKGRFASATFADDTTVFLQGQAGMYRRTFHLNNGAAAVSEAHDSMSVMRVYPDPAHGLLNLGKYLGTVTVLDALGRSRQCPWLDGKLDISELPAGVYYIISNSSHTQFVKE